MEEASRFGIMNTNDDDTIYEFEEKPKHPKSNHGLHGHLHLQLEASCGEYLIDDEADPKSSNDFGKNIIPDMLGERREA